MKTFQNYIIIIFVLLLNYYLMIAIKKKVYFEMLLFMNISNVVDDS